MGSSSRSSPARRGIASSLCRADGCSVRRCTHFARASCDARRARTLIRAGADLKAARTPGERTPLSIAKELEEGGEAEAGTTAWLVLRASAVPMEVRTGPWSPKAHLFFADAARARAVELMCVGAHMAREWPEGGKLKDVWPVVMAHAVTD